ncbi:glycosyltransferase family 2 protein [Planctomicrobium sp. SH661]|uniref:glycosyltransferase family 2 protein n=1 Tax=Planctomicrobium sp. SH661 TaxID=3448124 RepID=UPI003F5B628A
MTELSVIIPQHGQSECTVAAVRTLQQVHPFPIEILIVDDGSPAPHRTRVREHLAGNVTLLRLPRRKGITAAWNAGAKLASGRILVFLNNDTLSHRAWLRQLVQPLSCSPCLMTGCQWRVERWLADRRQKLLAGWCLAIRRADFFAAGEFDERFRLYFSDTDLQLRLLQRCRGSLTVVEDLPVEHLKHRSTRRLTSRSFEWRRDCDRFRQKWNLDIAGPSSGSSTTRGDN